MIFEIPIVTFTKLTHTTLNMEISDFPKRGVLTIKLHGYASHESVIFKCLCLKFAEII